VDRRFLAERLVEIHPRELAGVERADALLQGERPGEGLLHGHLLVEREADQQRERVAREQLVRVGIGCEVQCVGHHADSRLAAWSSRGKLRS